MRCGVQTNLATGHCPGELCTTLHSLHCFVQPCIDAMLYSRGMSSSRSATAAAALLAGYSAARKRRRLWHQLLRILEQICQEKLAELLWIAQTFAYTINIYIYMYVYMYIYIYILYIYTHLGDWSTQCILYLDEQQLPDSK